MIEPGEPIDSVEILKKITNYSKYEQEMLTVLYSDDWLQRVYDEFRSKNVAESTLEQISAIVEMMRSRYEAEEISLNEAAKSVREMVADLRRRLEQKHNRTQMKAQKESQRSSQRRRRSEQVRL
jgi:pyridoxal biosynthesis lyase PdxS